MIRMDFPPRETRTLVLVKLIRGINRFAHSLSLKTNMKEDMRTSSRIGRIQNEIPGG